MSPFSACFVAKLFDLSAKLGKGGTVLLPRPQSCHNQFHRMGLDKYLVKELKVRKGYVPTVPIHPIKSSEVSVATKITNMVDGQMKLPQGVKSSLQHSVHELLMNVVNHSESKVCNYVCANAIPTKGVIRLCVFDSGIGIRKSLNQNPNFNDIATDLEAIDKSLEYGVTRLRETDRGIGLSTLVQLIESNNGKMEIVSGTGYVTIESAGTKRKTLRIDHKGTVVNLTIKISEGFKPTFDDWEEGLDKWMLP